jgi:hypothetical protein
MGIPYLGKPPRHRCGDPGDEIPYACMFGGGQYFARTPAVAGCVTRWSFSAWVRRSHTNAHSDRLLGTGDDVNGSGRTSINFSDDTTAPALVFYNLQGDAAGIGGYAKSSAIYRDPASWMHVLAVWDSTNADPVARIRLYVNGARLTDLAASSPAALGATSIINTVVDHRIGTLPVSSTNFLEALLADAVVLDGIAADPSAFGYVNRFGVWVPRRFAGLGQGAAAYGAQGWHLDFADPLNLGKDISGNGNHWTPVNLTAANQTTDTPTHTCTTLTPLDSAKLRGAAVLASTLSIANTRVSIPGSSVGGDVRYSDHLIPQRGKWQAEATLVQATTANNVWVGVGSPGTGNILYTNDGSIPAGSTPWSTVGDTVGVLIDCDAGVVHFVDKGGALLASISFDPTKVYRVQAGGNVAAGDVGVLRVNFGQHDFAYHFAGYSPLSSAAMPCPPIKRAARYVTARLRSGGAAVTDLPWDPTEIKTAVLSRRRDAAPWRLNLSIRPGRAIATNGTTGDFAEADGLSFTPTGWIVGSASVYAGNRVDYAWRAARAAGFDILTVEHTTGTATTMAHAVGGMVDYAWVLNLSTGAIKRIYHRLGLTAGQYLALNTLDAAATDAGWFASTAVDLTLGAGLPTGTYAVLAWRAVPQFSSFGSHIGNSATDGGFAAMDFAPALVLAKNASAGSSYHTVQDIARSPINPVDNRLWLSEDGYAETSNGDGTSDFISTGWKTRTTHFGINGSGNTIIHAAWAAVPGKFARAR